MPAADIVIKGAREHNLRNVDLVIPRNQLICLTGVSGSGKSSLAFDTLYAEGQRRYVESLSSFARQFLGQMPKPDVDLISGLSPAISISQKSSGQNPRSTVGTITEIYDYLRVLFARVGVGHCPTCGRPITAQTRDRIIDRVSILPVGLKFMILAPVARSQKGEHRDLFVDLMKQGFARARVDGRVVQLADDLRLDRRMRHDIEVVVDRLTASPTNRARLAEAVELALRVGDGELIIAQENPGAAAAQEAFVASDDEREIERNDEIDNEDGESEDESTSRRSAKQAKRGGDENDIRLSAHYACTSCGISFAPPTPQLFSFNSPQGMCTNCDGLGRVIGFDMDLLIPDRKLSFEQGCIPILGPWDMMGRWRRHIVLGVFETLERVHGLEEGTLVKTPWERLGPEIEKKLLWGTGDLHVTFTWRHAGGVHKHGGTFQGFIPELQAKHRGSRSALQRRQMETYMRAMDCVPCGGARLNPQARSVTISTRSAKFADRPAKSLPEICHLAVSDAAEFLADLDLDKTRQLIAAELLKEIRGRIGFLLDVGLEYLTLDRTAPTLSGGESQRIRLAGQVGCGLVGVLYILDEPSIGLHPRDNDRLLGTLTRLRDLGNTVIVVEHDEETMRASDGIIDFGPGAGTRGGELMVSGSIDDVCREKRSVTGRFLSGVDKIEIPATRRPLSGKFLKIRGATHNNLKGIDVEIPLGGFVCVTGVSGSGKSSLVNGILAPALNRDLNRGLGDPGGHERIEGLEHLDKMIDIDQSPIGRTPRSNPATYIKVFDEIRQLFTRLPEARAKGFQEGRFSFNVVGGRCEACEGNGSNRLEMDFLADVWVTCPVCEGRRFNRETLQILFKGKSIAEVLNMDVQEAVDHFQNVPKARKKLQTLHDVGLDYMKLGQASPTLSGGEAQRVKLARELVKKSTGKTLYLLDEPTTGLHFADIRMLLKVLHDFADAGNTVLVVEHNLDVIKTADWVIDLGPEGGARGGHLVVAGRPEEVAKREDSYTGMALRGALDASEREALKSKSSRKGASSDRGSAVLATSIRVQGAREHNLRSVDLEIPRDKMSVCCGPSGSGKSSLAMDTVYAEGQRRYVESLSSYARQFVGQMQKPKLDHIEGLSPAIAIEQKHMGHSPRSTVGTVTEIQDYLRILFARLGKPYCPDCDLAIGSQTADEIIDKVMAHPDGTKLYLMAPLTIDVGQEYESLWSEMSSAGYRRIRVDGRGSEIDAVPKIDRRRKHLIEVVVDRVTIREGGRGRVADSVESALSLGRGVLRVGYPENDVPEEKWRVVTHSQHYACERCGRSFERLSPHNFSFNSALGWCPSCEGLGTQLGANPAALVTDPKLSLGEGAITMWPGPENAEFAPMLRAFAARAKIPLDVPFEQLTHKQKRAVMYGVGDDWIPLHPTRAKGKNAKNPPPAPTFSFQYKGLYPALEEAARLSSGFRGQLDHLVGEVDCSTCGGGRLRDDAAATRFRGQTMDEVCRMPLGELLASFENWKLTAVERKIAGELAREVKNRLRFLTDVGLEYLTLGRGAPTLSGGEAQRIRLASQVGSGLTGVLYVLDEPTIGLHPRDNRRLLKALESLRDLGNTLLMVEHDREVVEAADQLFDFGPGAGEFGGQIVARGTPSDVAKAKGSVTGPYLAGTKGIVVPENRRVASVASMAKKAHAKKRTDAAPAPSALPPGGGWLEVQGARHHNLRDVTVRFPLGAFTVVSGVSGSGKSSLVEDVLYNALARRLHRARVFPAPHDAIKGIERINKVIRVDQQPLGTTPNSNPATYTGVFELIRLLYAQLPEAKLRGYIARRFSFNVPGGRCEKCEGNGHLKIEMHFLPDIWIECDECKGKRYNPETLAVRYKGHSIADTLDMPCGKALALFENIPKIRQALATLCDVGLDYLRLGQPAPTLSGGEAQRVKLAAELCRPDTGKTLYLLDEPTTGLHFEDLAKLLDVLNRLVDLGNTVVVIEHNLDVIKAADWVIDMGPEAGAGGGHVVAFGTPEDLVAHAVRAKRDKGRSPDLHRSHTGEMLAPVLAAGPRGRRGIHDFESRAANREGDLDLADVGRDAQMPWETDGRHWHTRDRVGRGGEPCRWDGKVLAAIVDKAQELGDFSPTNWNSRTIVEIAANRKSEGWFLHASTGEEWLLKLKFRVARLTFKREDLVKRLDLKPLNDLPDLPVYGSQPRVQCKQLRGPWQEVAMQVHSFAEIDRPEFWSFLEAAVAGFVKLTTKMQASPEDAMPWKALGKRWHLSRKGFPPGKRVAWESDMLEELCEVLVEAAPQGTFLWNNQQVVHFCPNGSGEPWATIHTKRLASLDLTLSGPKNRFALGEFASLGHEPELISDRKDKDLIRLKFVSVEQLSAPATLDFFRRHLSANAR